MGRRNHRFGIARCGGRDMTQTIDMDLLREVISEANLDLDNEELAQLIHDLISEEFNVQHMIRPHKILQKLTTHLDEFNKE